MVEASVDDHGEARNLAAGDVVVSECRRWIAMGYNDGWLRVFDTASRTWAWEVSKSVFVDRWFAPGRIFMPLDTGVVIAVTPHHVLFFDVEDGGLLLDHPTSKHVFCGDGSYQADEHHSQGTFTVQCGGTNNIPEHSLSFWVGLNTAALVEE